MSDVYVIHENSEWTVPLFRALAAEGVSYVDWDLSDRGLDMRHEPPVGVFYNRMSASSHTRGHRFAPEMTNGVLGWLEAHQRRVLNGSGALRLELSKMVQYAALTRVGLDVPDTLAVTTPEGILEAYDALGGRVITKHNRAGKGLGVKLFESRPEIESYVMGQAFEPSVDGITLVQRYVESTDHSITRVEFVGRELVYAVRVDTSEGFELCPADGCALPDIGFAGQAAAISCVIDGAAELQDGRPKFEIIPDFQSDMVEKMQRLMVGYGVDVAAFEFVTNREGRSFVYDINTNTNYNPGAEGRAGVSAMGRLATVLKAALASV